MGDVADMAALIFTCLVVCLSWILPALPQVSGHVTNSTLAIKSDFRPRRPVFYILDKEGVFHRDPPSARFTRPSPTHAVVYTVLDSGVLVPKESEYAVKYNLQGNGDLVPDPSNRCIYTSSRPASYLRAFKGVLIPVEKSSNGKLRVGGSNATQELIPARSRHVVPDTSCSGEVVLFVLHNTGVLERRPPDPYLPVGLKTTYSLTEDFVLTPKFRTTSGKHTLSYFSGYNGDLHPRLDRCVMRSQRGEQVSFMLGEAGRIFPVREMEQTGEVAYYFNGRLIHCSRQFHRVQSNSSIILLNREKFDVSERDKHIAVLDDGPRFTCKPPMSPGRGLEGQSTWKRTKRDPEFSSGHRIQKRDVYSADQKFRYRNPQPPPHPSRPGDYNRPGHYCPPPPDVCEECLPPPPRPCPPPPPPPPVYVPPPRRNRITVCDERGVQVTIAPEATNNHDVILYKLTCQGHLVRFPPCHEPDFGFDVTFQLLLDTFTLIPTSEKKGLWLSYTLQANGDLRPCGQNINTFVKAPGSLVVFMLGKNNVLFVVEQTVNQDGSVTYYFEDEEVYRTPKEMNEPLKFFNTMLEPILGTVNGRTMFTCHSKRTVSAGKGSTWHNPNASQDSEKFSKELYLLSPDKEKIPVVPYKGSKSAPVVYDLDSHGVFHKSPKDKRKCICLKSYCLLEKGILLPTKDAKEYVYIVAKNGDLMPYVHPERKLTAPYGYSLKYVGCEGGILLPITIEIINNYICYMFDNIIVYKKKSFCARRNNCCIRNPWHHAFEDCDDFDDRPPIGLPWEKCKKKQDWCSSDESREMKPREKDSSGKKGGSSRKRPDSSEETGERCKKPKCKCEAKCTCGHQEKEGSSQESREAPRQFKLFANKEGSFIYYEKQNKLLVRHPPDEVPSYLKYTMGSFHIEEDRLKQAQFKDPDQKTINLMLEPNGDLLEDTRNTKHPESDYYVLAEDGGLIAVDAVKKGKTITFYKSGSKVFSKKISVREPLKLTEEPEPKKPKQEGPLYIPIPLKSLNMDDSGETSEPCGQLRESLKKLLKREGADDLAMNLEMTDSALDDIRRWAEKRDQRRYGQLKKRDLLQFLEDQAMHLHLLQ